MTWEELSPSVFRAVEKCCRILIVKNVCIAEYRRIDGGLSVITLNAYSLDEAKDYCEQLSSAVKDRVFPQPLHAPSPVDPYRLPYNKQAPQCTCRAVDLLSTGHLPACAFKR